jgi:RNA polymerase sigma-70 factor (ECF subfamily)
MTQPEPEFLPTRGTLLSRLKDMDDAGSWQQFFDTYWKLIYCVALKAGLKDAEAQDVVQETVIAVARNIGQFKYDPQVCAFKTWLLQVVRSRISNQIRRNKRHQSDRVGTGDERPLAPSSSIRFLTTAAPASTLSGSRSGRKT